MKDWLSLAIQSLKPNSEFSYTGNDYGTVEWHVLEGKAPTQAQIDAEIARLQANEATEIADRAAAKAALLQRLGLTSDEANLLLS